MEFLINNSWTVFTFIVFAYVAIDVTYFLLTHDKKIEQVTK